MMELKILTKADLFRWDRAKDLAEKLPNDWSGTVVDLLRSPFLSCVEKINATCHRGVLDDRTLRLFAVRRARDCELSYDAKALVDLAERYANNPKRGRRVTKDALQDARILFCNKHIYPVNAEVTEGDSFAYFAANGNAEHAASMHPVTDRHIEILIDLLTEDAK